LILPAKKIYKPEEVKEKGKIKAGQYMQLKGSPDWVLEIVSDDSLVRIAAYKMLAKNGDKAAFDTHQKRMAALGAVYTVDPYRRTPDEVVAALFRDPDAEQRRPMNQRVVRDVAMPT
jgi:hypothetical protein